MKPLEVYIAVGGKNPSAYVILYADGDQEFEHWGREEKVQDIAALAAKALCRLLEEASLAGVAEINVHSNYANTVVARIAAAVADRAKRQKGLKVKAKDSHEVWERLSMLKVDVHFKIGGDEMLLGNPEKRKLFKKAKLRVAQISSDYSPDGIKLVGKADARPMSWLKAD